MLQNSCYKIHITKFTLRNSLMNNTTLNKLILGRQIAARETQKGKRSEEKHHKGDNVTIVQLTRKGSHQN